MYALEVTPITSSILKESLTYFSKTDVTPGALVTIPLRKREVRGIVLSSSPVQNIKQNLRHQNFKIRNITQVHNEVLFSSAYLKTIAELKNYYLINTGKLIDVTYPRVITRDLDSFARIELTTSTPATSFSETCIQKEYTERIEYYAKLASSEMDQNQSVHIICPTVYDVKKLSTALENSGLTIHSLHGKTTERKLRSIYETVRTSPSLIVSTPSFMDIPACNRSHIIIEKDSSSHYTRAVAPYIDTRILAQQYARHSNIALIYADTLLRPLRYINQTTPAIDIFKENKITIVSAKEKVTKKQTDAERVKDLSEKKPFAPLSPKILKSISTSVKKSEKIFCYVPRKSLAPSIVCRTCGLLARDPDTKTPYSLYIKKNQNGEKERIYINTTNNKQVPAFDVCQHCDSWQLQTMGVGTDSVVEQLQNEFPDTMILACDSFHAKTETATKKVFKEFDSESESGKAVILVGTQKSIPYLDAINTSIISSIDGMLTQMSYTTEMRALYLLKNIAEQTNGKVIIQTRTSLEASLPSLSHNNQNLFIKNTHDNGLLLGSAPYGTILSIHHVFVTQDYEKLYQLYADRLQSWSPHITTRPYRKKGSMLLKIVLHLKKDDWGVMRQNLKLFEKLPFEERNIHIEINPEVF